MVFEAVERTMDLISKAFVEVLFYVFLDKLIHAKLLTPSEPVLIFEVGMIIMIEQTLYCMWTCFMRAEQI